MSLAVILFVQAATVAAAPANAAIGLGKIEVIKPCKPGGEEIVVCGRRAEDETFRLRPLQSDRFEAKPLRATIGVGNGTLGVENDQQAFGNGTVSKAVKLKLKMKF